MIGQVETLRDARKSFTRSRICAAARDVFAAQGVAEATLEQIAQAAGTRRSTIYNHFRDKDEILAAIAEEYGLGLVDLIDMLEGPVPTRENIDRWLAATVRFTLQERAPTALLVGLGSATEIPAAAEELGARLLNALALRVAAFNRALDPAPDRPLWAARARCVMQILGWSFLQQLRDPDSEGARSAQIVAAEHFERFARGEA